MLALAMTPACLGQAVAVAEVHGIVTDQSGGALAGAQVRMIQTATESVRSTVTDAEGAYSFPGLQVGAYRLEVHAQGFRDYLRSGIELQVGGTALLNVSMQVGSVSEKVEVTASAAMVETRENAIAQVMEPRKIVDLPLNGRNLTQLLLLTGAGTTAPAGDLTGSKNIQGSQGSGTFSVAGSQANGVSYLLDGGDNNDAFSNVNLPIPFPDAVMEFNVQTNGLGAQFGLHPGGTVNIVTKSGSNALHGDVFEFLRNYSFNARPKGTAVAGQPARDSLKRSQFGGVVGGKIIRDKLFFFTGYQQTVQRSNPVGRTAHVPTAATLAGDFSTIDAKGCQTSAKTLKDPLTGLAFPNNQIPTGRFDPASVKLVSNFIPTSPDPCGVFVYGQPANNPDWQIIGKIDYVRSEKHNIFGRYYIYDYTAQRFFDGKNALTTQPNPGNLDRSQTVTLGDNYTLSPTKINSFHATFDRRADNRGSAPNLFSPNDLGVKMFDNIPNYIQLTISNYFNVACGTCAPGYFNVNNYQISDDFSMTKGRHQLAFGFDFRKEQFNSTNNQQANGQITFNGGTTGDALADLMIGRMSQFVDGNALSDYMRQTVFAAYIQDTYRLSPRLTVNMGVRWEPSLPAVDKQGRGNQFSLPAFLSNFHSAKYPNAPAGLLFNTDSLNTHGDTFTQSHWLATSPRIGLVWDPNGDGKQSVRASFGLMHDSIELFYPERWTTNPPYASSVQLNNPTAPFSDPWRGYVSPSGVAGNPFPGAALFPAQGVYVTIPPDVHATYELKWNLAYQRQFGTNWLASATYVGSRSVHILGAHEINMPVSSPTATTGNEQARRPLTLLNPAQGAFYSSIVQTDDGNTASYHGLLLKLDHRLANHFTWLTNYTWSHCISTYDFGGELAGNNYQNPNNRAGERGDCNFDRRHIFNTSMVAESPGFGSGFAKALTKDWQLAPIISLYTGQPFNVTDGTDVSLTAVNADRPNVVSGVNPLPHTLTQWFNPAAFVKQLAGTFGNFGRDVFHAPGTIQWDMAISRKFSVTERLKLDVRGDFFNIMNHANWNAPAGGMTSATFGQVTSFGDPRLIQLAMKVYF